MKEFLTRRLRLWHQVIASEIGNHTRLLLVLLCAGSFALFSTYAIMRHLALWSGYFDLGLNSNSIWKTLNGYDSWQSLILPSTQDHINHISPILAPIASAYYVLPDPIILLLIQSAAISLAIVPLYYLSMKEIQNKTLSLLLAGFFLINPGLFGIVRFDFHVEAFVPVFVFLTYYAYQLRTPYLFFASIVLLLSTTEYCAVIGIGIALSLWIQGKKFNRRLGVILGASLALLVVIVMSTVGSTTNIWGWPSNWLSKHYTGTMNASATSYLDSPLSLLGNPVVLLNSIAHDFGFKLLYLGMIFAPFWQAPFRYFSRVIPALPWLAILLISTRLSFYSVHFQYSALLIPFVYVTGIPLMKQIAQFRKKLLSLAIIALIVGLTFYTVTPFLTPVLPQVTPDRIAVLQMDKSIPLNSTILTQNDLFPQISNRPFVTMKYDPAHPQEFVFIDRNTPGFEWTNSDLGYPLSIHQETDQLFTLYPYKLVQSQAGVELYQLQGPLR